MEKRMTENISAPVRRVDAIEKLTGRARYISDYTFAGLLHARMLRSDHPRARILDISVPELPEGYFYIDAKDIPKGGKNRISMIKDDWRVFAEGEVRYVGETIALIAGPEKEKVLEILSGITVIYEDLEPAFTLEEGLACKGGPIVGNDNLYGEYHLRKGNPEEAFKQAARIIKDTYLTGFQEHLYLEPQGMVGTWEEEKVTLYASAQCPFYIRRSVAGVLGVSEPEVRVKQATTGGAFGGKEHFPDVIATPLAVAVNKIRKPIQLVFERIEDISYTCKRHPSRITIKTALDSENNIIGMDIDTVINAGGYESSSLIVLQRAILHGISVYNIPNAHIRGRAVATNTFPSDAYRGFGAPQGLYAIEVHMSQVARELGMSPAEFKRKHFIKTGDTTITNTTMKDKVLLKEMLRKIDTLSGYSEKVKVCDRDPLKGIGIAFANHGCGFTGNGEQEIINAMAEMEHLADDRAALYVSTVEMGQGLQTVLRKIAARELGCGIAGIVYDNPDTSRVPDSGPTVASRSTMVVGFLVQQCARELKARWGEGPGVRVRKQYRHPEGLTWDQATLQGDAYPTYGWGVNVIEVALDPVTYEITTTGIWSVFDVGVPMDELIMAGQVSGGVIQALGYGALEKCEVRDGRFFQHTMADYTIPTSMDFPSVQNAFVENPYVYGPFGAKGAGELVFDAAAPAYADAVGHLLGKKINEIPVTPEKVMEALKR
jgi:CO/xanthine dehydrogenase Mo-binding subunit